MCVVRYVLYRSFDVSVFIGQLLGMDGFRSQLEGFDAESRTVDVFLEWQAGEVSRRCMEQISLGAT